MDTIAILERFVSEELLNNEVRVLGDDNLLADGLVDSLALMRLVGFIEDTFALDVPPQDIVIENFRTICAIAEYLERVRA